MWSGISKLLGWALVPVLVAQAGTDDWPQWGGRDDRNMVSAARNLPDVFVPGEKSSSGTGIDLKTTHNVRWAVRLGSQTYASPAVAGGRVYIATNELSHPCERYGDTTVGGVVMCLDEATGKLLWQLVCRCMEETPKTAKYFHNRQQLGICATPTVEGDRVYVVNNRAEVLCLDAKGRATATTARSRTRATTPWARQTAAALGPHRRRHRVAFRHAQGSPHLPARCHRARPC